MVSYYDDRSAPKIIDNFPGDKNLGDLYTSLDVFALVNCVGLAVRMTLKEES